MAFDDALLTFTVEVDLTDAARTRLPEGGFKTTTSTVKVDAYSDEEATRVAAQMVAGRAPQEAMVLATRITNVVA